MDNGGYTLIESFSLSNNVVQGGSFRDFLFNGSVNNDSPISLTNYRLDLTRLNALRSVTQRWRATCNAHLGLANVQKRDFVVVRHAVRDFLSTGGGCTAVDSINVRGIACSGCLVYIAQGNTSPYRDHIYIGSNTYCGAGSISNT